LSFQIFGKPDEDDEEGDESLQIVLSNAVNATLGTPSSAEASFLEDCGCNPQSGRAVTGLSSDKGKEFWEGDTVTFTASLSSQTPESGETFEWEKRPLIKILNGVPTYGAWDSMDTGFGVPDESVDSIFLDPFIGQVRVTLSSGDSTSSQIIDVRAKAAYPVKMVATGFARVGDHLEITYAWSSSSGRLADLDGVRMGEFLWFTEFGYNWGTTLVLNYYYPNPPFGWSAWSSFSEGNGLYIERIEDATTGGLLGDMIDSHGAGVPIYTGAAASVTVKQRYWYQLEDAYQYPVITEIYYGEGTLELEKKYYVGDSDAREGITDRTIRRRA
jgi:hypothetical protein